MSPLPILRACCLARALSSERTKTARAWLCGRRERVALFLAASSMGRSMVSVIRPSVTSMGWRGIFCRSRTALAITSAIRGSPLSAATSGRSLAVAVTPG